MKLRVSGVPPPDGLNHLWVFVGLFRFSASQTSWERVEGEKQDFHQSTSHVSTFRSTETSVCSRCWRLSLVNEIFKQITDSERCRAL